jgi:protocatechuate 3,4-dioxygenase beta subunit
MALMAADSPGFTPSRQVAGICRRSSAAILGLMLTGLCSAQSAAPHQSATVSGTVTSIAGEPLRRATVRLAPAPGFPGVPSEMGTSNAVTVTGAQGNFSFTDIAPGRYSLTAERIGFPTLHISR